MSGQLQKQKEEAKEEADRQRHAEEFRRQVAAEEDAEVQRKETKKKDTKTKRASEKKRRESLKQEEVKKMEDEAESARIIAEAQKETEARKNG